jgi:hypothetical protein
LPTAEQDPDHPAAQAAQAAAELQHADVERIRRQRRRWPAVSAEAGPLVVDELAGWSVGVCRSAGYEVDDEPVFVVDLPAAGDLDGLYEGETRVVHLRAGAVERWTVLHEVAHWLVPEEVHGRGWRAVFVRLVAEGIGATAAEVLAAEFVAAGLPV